MTEVNNWFIPDKFVRCIKCKAEVIKEGSGEEGMPECICKPPKKYDQLVKDFQPWFADIEAQQAKDKDQKEKEEKEEEEKKKNDNSSSSGAIPYAIAVRNSVAKVKVFADEKEAELKDILGADDYHIDTIMDKINEAYMLFGTNGTKVHHSKKTAFLHDLRDKNADKFLEVFKNIMMDAKATVISYEA